MNTSNQLKDLIKNKARQYNLNPQILLTRFFMERFLERISLSSYKFNFVLKGGILISSMVGVGFRMTKDMDLTIKNFPLDEVFLKNALEDISKIKIDDGTTFEILDVLPIREDFDYSGFRARLKCQLDKTKNIIQIDITTGDIITPSEVIYSYDLLIEKRKIAITCYPIETILAEKIESILSKNITTTRMKDFYDCYMFGKLYIKDLNRNNLILALKNTAKVRKTEFIFNSIKETIDLISDDDNLNYSWQAYSSQFNYAKDISFENAIGQLTQILKCINLI